MVAVVAVLFLESHMSFFVLDFRCVTPLILVLELICEMPIPTTIVFRFVHVFAYIVVRRLTGVGALTLDQPRRPPTWPRRTRVSLTYSTSTAHSMSR